MKQLHGAAVQTARKKGDSTLRRVLIIDDDPVSLSLTALLLESEGLHVLQKNSGENACRDPFPPDWTPDLVLADLQMPGLHGAPLADRLAQRWPEAHLIAMSAAPSEPVPGYMGVLQKPLPMEGLLQMLQHLCTADRKPSGRPRRRHSDRDGASEPLALDEDIFCKLRSRMQPAALREFIEVMLADAGRRIEMIRVAADTGDLLTARREAHTIRGAAGMAGALALRDAACAIEEMKVNSLDDLRRRFARLRSEHARVSVILASKLP